MNQATAIKLIGSHRRRWRSFELDVVIAKRGQQLYWTMGLFFIFRGLAFPSRHVAKSWDAFHVVILCIQCVAAVLFFWQGWRFTQVRRLLRKTKTNSL